eukprot:SAG31_NODE_1054_length_10140_cov_4.264316_17_plen_80_part_00
MVDSDTKLEKSIAPSIEADGDVPASAASPQRRLLLRCVTWNLGGCTPCAVLSELLSPGHCDMYVVGTQEACSSIARAVL